MLPHSLNPLDYPARFQWGQAGISNALSRTACTDTCVQMIIEYWKEKTYSLQAIRNASGKGVDGIHGLTINEAMTALSVFGVRNYSVSTGVNASYVLQRAYYGPVLFGVGYNGYPAKKGVWCDQDNVAQIGGKVDCNFSGPHAELALGNVAVKNAFGKIVRYDCFIRDPDHWEVSAPSFDRITGAQLTRSIEALKGNEGWTTTFCIYPTSKKVL